MPDVAVSIRGLGKRYQISHDRQRYARLTESIAQAVRHPLQRTKTEDFWALRDVTFDVPRGEVVGVIGRNGAGKSTLLKILSRITEPTEGEAILRGRVGSLLEVGTGFHPELTGRENIFLSGSILGMRRADIRRRFDEIVAFADIDRFLDTPVKRYSSGMQVRLGFAVAAHLEPEILIVDEVLAVGDAAFQKKCLAKMEDVAHGGRTVLFVSHNMAAVQGLCGRGLLLVDGQVEDSGPVPHVVSRYLESVRGLADSTLDARRDRESDGPLRITGLSASLVTGQGARISVDYSSAGPIGEVEISLGIFTSLGEGVAYFANALTGDRLANLPEHGSLECLIDSNPILPGRYTVNVHVLVNGHLSDWIQEAATIEVEQGDAFGTGRLPPSGYGHVAIRHRWRAQE